MLYAGWAEIHLELIGDTIDAPVNDQKSSFDTMWERGVQARLNRLLKVIERSSDLPALMANDTFCLVRQGDELQPVY